MSNLDKAITKQDEFVKSPFWILRRAEITPVEKDVLLTIKHHARPRAFPGRELIASLNAISTRSVTNATKKLEKMKVISINRAKRHHTYSLCEGKGSVLQKWRTEYCEHLQDKDWQRNK